MQHLSLDVSARKSSSRTAFGQYPSSTTYTSRTARGRHRADHHASLGTACLPPTTWRLGPGYTAELEGFRIATAGVGSNGVPRACSLAATLRQPYQGSLPA